MLPFVTPSGISSLSGEDFLEGRLILIDKPYRWTSFDAVKKVKFAIRNTFGLKKIKVGHAGTLDPLATGLLLICTGRFTKKITELTLSGKTYEGKFFLGATTPSYDLETKPENVRSTEGISDEEIQKAAGQLTGIQEQIPPAYSAKYIDGKRAYVSARKGIEVILPANKIEIKKFKIDASELPFAPFEIACSKGTYIRSVARDLGEILGCGAYLAELKRTEVGPYLLEHAIDPEEFAGILNTGT